MMGLVLKGLGSSGCLPTTAGLYGAVERTGSLAAVWAHRFALGRALKARTVWVGLTLATTLSGCYVVPMGPDGRPMAIPVPASQAPSVGTANHGMANNAVAPILPISARLYPDNDLAASVGVLQGSVINRLDGSGQIEIFYPGEVLRGEATRERRGEARGIANAFGARGTYANCVYQMNSPTQGTGSCQISTGARFRVHLGG